MKEVKLLGKIIALMAGVALVMMPILSVIDNYVHFWDHFFGS